MSTENNAVDTAIDVDVDLDAFSADFFGQKEAPEAAATAEDNVVETPVDDAPSNEDTQEVDTLDNEDDDDGEQAEEIANEPKKKTRFQERIDELTAGRREAERKAAELEARLAQLESAKQNPEQTKAPEAEAVGPDPYAKNEDGTDVYPMGEYDPAYLRDFTKHLLAEERTAMLSKEAEAAKTAAAQIERQTLQAAWETKLEPAQERYPDFIEKSTDFVNTFSDLDPAYGEYLTNQIMDLEYGTDVLYYLANNPDEAKKIVQSGARKASVSLGRIDAKFMFAEEEKQRARPRVSKAPTPPPTNKGSAVARIEAAPDTDDLDAFEKSFFKRR